MEIVGRHVLLFDDDASLEFVNSVGALVPWSENPSLLIDRYDVRHLLQRVPPPLPKRQGFWQEDDGDGVLTSDLDRERYHDLPLDDIDRQDGSEAEKEKGTYGSGAYQAVPFSYTNNDGSVQKGSGAGSEYSGYHPPFPLPKALVNNLPPTEKMHQIIAKTATFVSKQGGQSEIILRVKQGDNPTFGFLMPDHHLHSYFRYLVDHSELVKNVNNVPDGQVERNKDESGKSKKLVAAGGALSLLGSVYSSGEDEENYTHNSDSKDMESSKLALAVTSDTVHKSENETSSWADVVEAQNNSNAISVAKEIISLKKNPQVIDVQPDNSSSKTNAKTSTRAASNGRPWLNLHDTDNVVVEPSLPLKRMVEKIVEFIVKNGKEFQAILIEQDRSHGRFPFLLSSNIYHSYYLKVLREAQETKILGKNRKDHSNDSLGRGSGLEKSRGSKESTACPQHPSNPMECLYDPESKDKFKMVIGGQKKEANESLSRVAKKSGISSDVAAAIVMVATRGYSSPTERDFTRSGVSTEAAAAIVMQVTRRSSSPTKLDSRGICNSIHNNKLQTSFGADLSVSSARLGGDDCSKTNNVIFSNVIAKTAAIAAASEADSSEASLTKEQKQKAERLKRAKMFAAMIKTGDGKEKLLPSAAGLCESHSAAGLCESHSAASGSVVSRASDLTRREREGSSVPTDAETMVTPAAKSDENDPADRRGEHNSRHHISRSSKHNDEESIDGHKRKKHRSHHSTRSDKDDHKHKKRRHSSSKCKDNSSDEDHQHRKKSRSRDHRHEDCSSSDDDHHHRNSHRRFRRADTENLESIPEDQVTTPRYTRDASTRSLLEGQPSMETEVSDDLRAKVRAMLLATL